MSLSESRKAVSLRRIAPQDRRVLEQLEAEAEAAGLVVVWLNGYGTIAIQPELAAAGEPSPAAAAVESPGEIPECLALVRRWIGGERSLNTAAVLHQIDLAQEEWRRFEARFRRSLAEKMPGKKGLATEGTEQECRIVLALDGGGYDAIYIDGKLVIRDHSLYADEAFAALQRYFGVAYERLELALPDGQDFPPTLAEARGLALKGDTEPCSCGSGWVCPDCGKEHGRIL